MKLFVFFSFIFFSAFGFAHEYKITRFEASDYRDFTESELLELLGENRHLVSHLKCNGRDEFELFSPPLRMNPLRNSLRIKAQNSQELLTYQLGHYYNENGQEVFTSEDPFITFVMKALKRFETLPPTNKILRFLEESYFPLTITKGRDLFNPQVEGQRSYSGMQMAQAIAFLLTKRKSSKGFFQDIGVGGRIQWNPYDTFQTVESDGVRRIFDNDVTLAHEMYHAFDSIRGKLDMGMVTGAGLEFTSIVEYRGVYFENLVRKELGLKYRKFYGDPTDLKNGDLLDENDEPIYIPSTCL